MEGDSAISRRRGSCVFAEQNRPRQDRSAGGESLKRGVQEARKPNLSVKSGIRSLGLGEQNRTRQDTSVASVGVKSLMKRGVLEKRRPSLSARDRSEVSPFFFPGDVGFEVHSVRV